MFGLVSRAAVFLTSGCGPRRANDSDCGHISVDVYTGTRVFNGLAMAPPLLLF
jgi:hypothetical protein